jgi:hypothetical protein
MAIDIRATVTCSLGTLISGSISDDYLQGSGLVKTRGTCEISGLITPAVGTAVTFSYTKGGVTTSIPRKLRVLSSFADPFRRTTKVELGCKLTYLSDLQEPIKWEAFDDPENASYDTDDQRIVTLPIHASSVMAKCLTELGITASSSPLTNKFSIAAFDFGAGYVQVLNDLLVSESYFGYLDASEVLQIASLDQEGGTGPVYTSADIVDLGPIGTGQLPGEAVTVSYSSLKLKDPDANADNDAINWEYSFVSTQVEVPIIYTPAIGGSPSTQIYRGIESTETITNYTVVNGQSVVQSRVATENRIAASVAGSLINQYLSNGLTFSGSAPVVSTSSTFYIYDPEGNEIQTDTIKQEQLLAIYGDVGLDMVFSSSDYVVFSLGANAPRYTTERVVVQSQPIGDYTSSTTRVYGLWNRTIAGQQSIAQSRDSLTTASAVTGYVGKTLSNSLNLLSVTVATNQTGREAAQARPAEADRTNAAYAKDGDPNNGWRTESEAELELALGSATAQRRIEFSMPYVPDDIFSGPSGGPFTATPSDAAAKANRYGRVQNRLLLGNRSGVNLQLAPERLPVAPFSPLYLQADGLTALYRSNGNQWAFDSNGIVCSTDALFWAAVGGTGTFWFPVAPGVTTLPAEPAIVDGQMNATNTVLPYNETAVYEGRLRLGNVVTKFDYSLSLLTVVPALVLRTQAEVRRILKVEVPAASNSVAALVPKVSGGGSVKPPLASMALTALAPAVAGGSSVKVPLSSVEVAGLNPEQAGKFKLQIFVPSAGITDTAATPIVSGGASIASPVKSITVQALTPKLLDANAAAYIAAVEAADGQDLEEATYYAINDFVLGCKTDGIWSAIKACCILAGARTLTGALTPLVGAAPTNVNFVSGDYNRKTGLIGDGNTKYINTNRNRQDDPQNSHHIAAWLTTVPTNGTVNWIFGGGSGGGEVGATHLAANSSVFVLRHSSNAAVSASGSDNSLSTGLVGLNRSTSASFTYYRNGQSVSKTLASDGRVNSTLSIYTTGTFSNSTELSNQRAAFYSIGESLDLGLLSARVSQLLTDLTNAIP